MNQIQQKVKIYLADLAYSDPYSNVEIMPLNIGYIAAYLQKLFPNIVISLFKDADELLSTISKHPPFLLGLSHLCWNSNLDLAVIDKAKHIDKNIITVFGGINFQHDNPEWISHFFSRRPSLDLYITGEGESGMARLLHLLLNNSLKLENIPLSEWPSNFWALDKKRKKIINNPHTKIKLLKLDEIPSPYLTGLLDKFLKDPNYVPAMETNRGCPFSCLYCCWGRSHNSVLRKFPLDRVIKEIKYISNNTANKERFLYICDANFGLYERDKKISEVLKENNQKTGFPSKLYLYFTKDSGERVIEIAKDLKGMLSMSMSLQSLNEKVLKNIGRKNIAMDYYIKLHDKCKANNIPTICDLIYPMPGETYESFIEGAVKVCKNEQKLVIYNLVLFNGAAISSQENRKKYEFETVFRINLRDLKKSDNINSAEYEEIVIATKDFSRADYFRTRLFHFFLFVFRHSAFTELRHLLQLKGLDCASLASFFYQEKTNNVWKDYLRSFKESISKRFLNKDQVKLKYTKEEIEKIEQDDVPADMFFLALLISSKKVLNAFKEQIVKYFESNNYKNLNEINAILEISFDKLLDYRNLSNKTKNYNYDIEKWLSEKKPLKEFASKEPIKYTFEVDEGIKKSFEEALPRSHDLIYAIVKLRLNRVFDFGDGVYCYKRVKMKKSRYRSGRAPKKEIVEQAFEEFKEHGITVEDGPKSSF